MASLPGPENDKTVRDDPDTSGDHHDDIEQTVAMDPAAAVEEGEGGADTEPASMQASPVSPTELPLASDDQAGRSGSKDSSQGSTSETVLTQHSGDDAGTVGTVLSDGEVSDGTGPIDGTSVDRFELLRVLGQGAFGTVYLARDPRLDRAVAIKVARTGVLSSKKDIDRFNREACAAAQLRHPNIVPVYEVGQIKGATYIVYEYIEGTTLKDKLKLGRIPPAEAVQLMVSIADALHYAHESGIIHRDVKPENILLDHRGQPHIADFGLARREEDATRTREGTLMGTPAYMSPEQAAGRVSEVDRRSDIWSLGIMLDELLTTRRPFSGTVVEVLAAVQDQPIKPLRAIDPTLPVDLETICSKALERDLDRRFQTAKDLSHELQCWQRGEPITIRRITAFERLTRWAKRNKTIASLLAVLFIVLTLGTTLSTWFGISATRTAEQLTSERDARVQSQIQSVLRAEPGAVSALLDELKPLRGSPVISKKLREMAQQGISGSDKLAASRLDLLQLYLSTDQDQTSGARQRLADVLLTAEAREFVMLREQLTGFIDHGFLWERLQDPAESTVVRLHAAAAMALYDAGSSRWNAEIGADVAAMLLAENLNLSEWVRALRPIRQVLRPTLRTTFATAGAPGHDNAALVLAAHYGDDAELMSDLISAADADQLGLLASQVLGSDVTSLIRDRLNQPYPGGEPKEKKDAEDIILANHVLTLLHADEIEAALATLREQHRNGVRSHVVNRAASARVAPHKLLRLLTTQDDPFCLQTAILCLGELASITPRQRTAAVKELQRLFAEHPDSGVHGAIDWLMRKWHLEAELGEWSQALQSPDWPDEGRNWHHDPTGMVFAIFRRPKPFSMGTDDPIRGTPLPLEERPHVRTIPRSFAISMKEVTLEQYRKFRPKHDSDNDRSLMPTHPVKLVRWYGAAAFCVELCRNGKVDEGQICYVPGKNKGILHAKSQSLELTGYRLPTSAEWEYACRGGTTTLRYYGSSSALLSSYAWTASGSSGGIRPVGQLLPNQFGLFDSLGNVAEWCHTWLDETRAPGDSDLVDGYEPELGKYVFREARGGSIDDVASDVLSGARGWADTPMSFSNTVGFRVARTLPD